MYQGKDSVGGDESCRKLIFLLNHHPAKFIIACLCCKFVFNLFKGLVFMKKLLLSVTLVILVIAPASISLAGVNGSVQIHMNAPFPPPPPLLPPPPPPMPGNASVHVNVDSRHNVDYDNNDYDSRHGANVHVVVENRHDRDDDEEIRFHRDFEQHMKPQVVQAIRELHATIHRLECLQHGLHGHRDAAIADCRQAISELEVTLDR